MSVGASEKPVRVAVVGLGYWGPNLARNLHDLPVAALEVVCDLRAETIAAIESRYPTVRGVQRYEDVFADPDIEAVVIATPVATHFDLALAAAQAGKHVFVEKPLALSSDDARHLVDEAERAGLVLMPGHIFLYSPPVNIVKDLITAGELGDIYFISSSRVNLGIHQSDASVVWDLAPHDFSILRYWLDEMPDSVSAISRSCVIPGIADVRVHQPCIPIRHPRAR